MPDKNDKKKKNDEMKKKKAAGQNSDRIDSLLDAGSSATDNK